MRSPRINCDSSPVLTVVRVVPGRKKEARLPFAMLCSAILRRERAVVWLFPWCGISALLLVAVENKRVIASLFVRRLEICETLDLDRRFVLRPSLLGVSLDRNRK
jgi:hypothetical protein